MHGKQITFLQNDPNEGLTINMAEMSDPLLSDKPLYDEEYSDMSPVLNVPLGYILLDHTGSEQ